MKIVTTAASDRVAKFAFQYALENKKKESYCSTQGKHYEIN